MYTDFNKLKKPYNDFGSFLTREFPFKVQKVSVNAGFTCPNRDGSKGSGGCTYCNNQSFSPSYGESGKTVTQQLKEGISFFMYKYPQMKYLAYFQSYTNTYDTLDNLIVKYEEALRFPGVVGLIIGTRPDCMPDELLDYFTDLNKKTFLMVEYGVESTCEHTLASVNRGHTFEESRRAIIRTAERKIYTGCHMILGLPGETKEDILGHSRKLSELPLTTIKLHQLQLIKGTAMAVRYQQSPQDFTLFGVEEYIDLCVDFTEILHPSFFIERFVSQSPRSLLISPDWGYKNYQLVHKIVDRFHERETWQGKFYTD